MDTKQTKIVRAHNMNEVQRKQHSQKKRQGKRRGSGSREMELISDWDFKAGFSRHATFGLRELGGIELGSYLFT